MESESNPYREFVALFQESGELAASNEEELIEKLSAENKRLFSNETRRGTLHLYLRAMCLSIYEQDCQKRKDFYAIVHYGVILPFLDKYLLLFNTLSKTRGTTPSKVEDLHTLIRIQMKLSETMIGDKLKQQETL
jgi:hypothetical protein